METHALALPAAQYGKVGFGYAYHCAKLLAGYTAALQHFVQIYLYRHTFTLNNAVVIVLNALRFGNEAAEYEREQGEKHTGKGDACGNVNVAQSARKRYLHCIERGAAYYGCFQADNGKTTQPLRMERSSFAPQSASNMLNTLGSVSTAARATLTEISSAP